MDALEIFQQSIGYKFVNQSLLTLALSHKSYSHKNNERLEYLGDSILGFVISTDIYIRFPQLSEGDLTKIRSNLVKEQTLAAQARKLNIQHIILLGSGEIKNSGGDRNSILSDALEAVFGAIYLDQGFLSVKHVILSLFKELLSSIEPKNLRDPKTLLQEILQKKNLPLPIYTVTGQSGEQHNLLFTISCVLQHINKKFVATGKNKKMTEQAAAQVAVDFLS